MQHWSIINGSYLREVYKLKSRVIIHLVFHEQSKSYCCSIVNSVNCFIPQYDLEDKSKEMAKFKALLRAKELGFEVNISNLNRYGRF